MSRDAQGQFSVAPADDAIVVGETAFFEVRNPNPLNGVSFFVKDCTVSDDDGNEHMIINDNCNAASVNTASYSNTITSDNAIFSYTAFMFSNRTEFE